MQHGRHWWFHLMQRMPKPWMLVHSQPIQQPQPDPGPVRDWEAHWKAQGQPWRRESEIDVERQQFLRQQLDSEIEKIAPFDGISLGRADLEWLGRRHQEKSVGKEIQPYKLTLQSSILSAVDCGHLPLEGVDFRGAQLEGADFYRAQLKGASFGGAVLEGAGFQSAQLEGADFRGAKLEGADFYGAQLEGADFRGATISNAIFEVATFVTNQGVGLTVADVTGWDERSLPIREWLQVKWLGDEAIAKVHRNEEGKRKDVTTHFEDYFAATRAYRQISIALDGMGRKEEAEKFAYRGQVMQRKMLWWSIWQEERTFWQRLTNGRAWLFSGLLTLLSGYGYRFGRSFSWYVGVLVLFALLYLHISQGVPPHSTIPNHLSWFDACILSISDMVGRGFFRQFCGVESSCQKIYQEVSLHLYLRTSVSSICNLCWSA